MVRPRIWAPRAPRLDVVVGGEPHAAQARDGGWWQCPLDLHHGTEYWLRSADGRLLPDPRSVDQPRGLSGPSRVFDPSTLRWSDDGFTAVRWDDAVLYELHPGTFTTVGTLDSAIGRLDHLVTLGVTHVELTPVHTFAGDRGWGYDGVLLFAPHCAYGGPAALARFVDAAHACGLAVVLDVVYNHIGPGAGLLSTWGPYFAAEHETPWGPTPDFTNPEVRRFICDNALSWLRDFHIDGLRLDAVQAMVDGSAPHILQQLACEVAALEQTTAHRYTLIAETIFNDRHMVEPATRGGYGLHAHWNEDFHHALHAAVTSERTGYYADYGPLSTLAHVLATGYWFDGTRESVYHRRAFGEAASGLHGRQCVAYLQNHDQVGNRPDGARVHKLAGMEGAKIGSALTLLGPFVPMLFQGEEWAASCGFHFFCDHDATQLRDAVRGGRRGELTRFGWDVSMMRDPYEPTTVAVSTLDWTERTLEHHASMMEWVCALIQLRRSAPELSAGPVADVDVHFDEASQWLTMRRGSYEVVATFGPASLLLGRPRCVLALQSGGATLTNDRLLVPGRSVAVVHGP